MLNIILLSISVEVKSNRCMGSCNSVFTVQFIFGCILLRKKGIDCLHVYAKISPFFVRDDFMIISFKCDIKMSTISGMTPLRVRSLTIKCIVNFTIIVVKTYRRPVSFQFVKLG